MEEKIVGLQRCCPGCGHDFVICTACDRWHWYCSPICRQAARLATLRRAAKAYRDSEKGREASRRNQREYRRRKRQRLKSVSHQSSLPLQMAVDPPPQPISEENSDEKLHRKNTVSAVGACMACRRPVHFLMPIAGFVRRRPRRGGLSRCYLQKLKPR